MWNGTDTKILIAELNDASYAYYNNDNPIMSDKVYDALYDKLVKIEEETGIVYPDSPTQKVQGFLLDNLNKVKHSKPMLSAKKTKLESDVISFLGANKYYCSFKADGGTLVVTYNDGCLFNATTRGDGIMGEDVTEQAKTIANLPLKIPYTGYLEIRGECIISWDNFNRINELLEEKYSHPRNLATGSIRKLDTTICKSRMLEFVAFECISDLETDSKLEALSKLEDMGIQVVDRYTGNVSDAVKLMTADKSKYPVDGLVFEIDSIKDSKEMGVTGHHERCRIALKWADETQETTLREVVWNTSRSGAINPVAIFDSVNLDGADVTRATLHNLSIMEQLQLGIGDTISVYKANMIIPKIDDNLTRSNTLEIPKVCPYCGAKTEIIMYDSSKFLYCTGEECGGKRLSALTHFVSKKAMDIDGLSEAQLNVFMNYGFISTYKDVYNLSKYEDIITNLNGFGRKSYDNLIESIEKSRNVSLEKYIVALAIPNIGTSASKTLSKRFNGDYDKFINSFRNKFNFTELEDFGETMYISLYKWYNSDNKLSDGLEDEVNFIREEVKEASESIFTGKIVVATGSVEGFTRITLQQKLEEMGAKVVGSVSKNTDYLIMGKDAGSKLKKAQDLGVKIIDESKFLTIVK